MDDKIRIEKEYKKVLPEELKNISESVLQLLFENAIKDAQKLFDNGDITGDFKQVTYTIYKAYVLGILFEKSNVKQNQYQYQNQMECIKKDNIIYMNFN